MRVNRITNVRVGVNNMSHIKNIRRGNNIILMRSGSEIYVELKMRLNVDFRISI